MAPKRKAKPEPSSKASASIKETTPVDWPPLAPLIPESDLALHTKLSGQIVTISNVWTATLCKNYVSFLSSLPLTTTPGQPKRGDAVRVNDRFQIDDAVFAETLWSGTALKNLVLGNTECDGLDLNDSQRKELWGGEVVGLNPNIRVYRYSKGQFFDQHCTSHSGFAAAFPEPSLFNTFLREVGSKLWFDKRIATLLTPLTQSHLLTPIDDDSNNVTVQVPGSPSIPARTTWTLLLYLTSLATGCVGGETVFYPEHEPSRKKSKEPPPEPVVCELEVGLALLHRHGAQCMLHEGREVLQGEKWVIRSDLCVRR